MAVMQLAFTSQYLHVNTNVAVILPDIGRDEEPRQFYENYQKYRVLWLLPGLNCDHSQWLRQTNVERYACQQETVVVMPSAQNSDYLDWDSFSTGFEAYSFFFKELIPLVRAWLPVSAERSKNAIAGATDAPIRLALHHPELFEAAFKMDGPLTNYEALLQNWEPVHLLTTDQASACRMWRETAEPEQLRLLNLVDRFSGKACFLQSDCNVIYTLTNLSREQYAALPHLHFFAGKTDGDFPEFLQRLAARGIPVDFRQFPAREDIWERLDGAIEAVLKQYEKEEKAWR